MSRTDPHLAELEAQIAQTREALGQTVEELAAKADVPGRAKAKAHDTAERLRSAEHRTREKAAMAKGRTRERAQLTAGRVRESARTSAGSAKAHLPGRSNGKAGEPGAVSSGTSTELTPTGETGAHRVGGEVAEGSSRMPVAAGAALVVAAALAITWARHHEFTSRSVPPPMPERIPWRIRASSRPCTPHAT